MKGFRIVVIVLFAFIYTINGSPANSASEDTPRIDPPKYCSTDNQGRPYCIEFQKMKLECYLQNKNGDVFNSQQVDLHVDSGATTLAMAPTTGPAESPDQTNFRFVKTICGESKPITTPCYE